ncbi:Vam6/Vps39-like protein [Borealophlyctis nickersoniae]|nr:Vam6/Vps39-like protein [Borealophlyctis nickersoniae]
MSSEEQFKGYAAFEKAGSLKPFSFTPPPLGPTDVEIAITCCGICGSDIHTIDSGWRPTKYPVIVGHEIVGTVTAKGSAVKRFNLGDRVGVGAQRWSCLKKDCKMCNRGFENCCPEMRWTYGSAWEDGTTTQGGYANKTRAKEEVEIVISETYFTFKIPDNLDSHEAAPLLCAGVTTYAPLKRYGAGPGKTVGVIGIGGLGHLGLQWGRALGAKVVAISHSPSKKQEALRLGADTFITLDDFRAHKNSMDIILCTAHVPNQDWRKYLSLLDVNGKLLLVSLPEENLSIPPFALTATQVGIIGSSVGSVKEIEEMLQLASEKNIKAVVEVMPVEKCNEAIEKVRKGTLVHRTQLAKTRGASLLSVWANGEASRGSLASLNGVKVDGESDGAALENVCVVVKERLMFYTCTKDTIAESKVIKLPDRARTLVWIERTKLVAGLPRGYWLVDIVTNAATELLSVSSGFTSALGKFTTVKMNRPTVTCLPEKKLMLGKDNMSSFVTYEGPGSPERDFEWSAAPEEIGLVPPQVEVRSLKTGAVVQLIDLPQARFMIGGPTLYVASPTSIWRLLPLDFEDQIEQLIGATEYIEAQRLIEELEFPTEEDKIANIIRVRGLYAHHIFTHEKKYLEAVTILQELKASPIDVINLYPDLAIESPEPESEEPIQPSDRKALLVLMDYLTSQRSVLAKTKGQIEQSGSTESISGAPPPSPWPTDYQRETEYPNLADIRYLMQVVDTTLLKVYLRVNPALVGPLLRVRNYCSLEDCEELLKENQKYLELVELYRGKGLHKKALDFLIERASSSDATFEFERMIAYLQALSMEEHADLILDYAAWILQRDSEEGMKVFTEHYDETTTPTRLKITNRLDQISPSFAITYLEHLVWEQNESTPEFHDRLVLCYLDQLSKDLVSRVGLDGPMLPNRPVGDTSVQPRKSFWSMRRTLARFLEVSKVYDAEQVLKAFPENALFEERATVLSRLGRHEDALRIYTEKIRNYQLANMYCEKHYNPIHPTSKDVFLILLRLYLDLVSSGQIEMTIVVSFLGLYGPCIDGRKALKLLPSTIPLSDLVVYFEKTLHDMHRVHNMDDVVKNLLKAERYQVNVDLPHCP